MIRGFYQGFICFSLVRTVSCQPSSGMFERLRNNRFQEQQFRRTSASKGPDPAIRSRLATSYTYKPLVTEVKLCTQDSSCPVLPFIKLSQRLHLPARDRLPGNGKAPGAGFTPSTCILAPPELCVPLAEQEAPSWYLLMRFSSRMTAPCLPCFPKLCAFIKLSHRPLSLLVSIQSPPALLLFPQSC